MINTSNLLALKIQSQMLEGLSDKSNPSGGATAENSFESLLAEFVRMMEPSSGLTQAVNTAEESAESFSPSQNLVDFLKIHEGYSGLAYRGADVQNQTIGYGHVLMPGETINSLSQGQAESLLKQDLSGPVASVKKEFADVNLTQNQFDALVSFAYNLGDNIWKSAPKLVQDIKTGASSETLREDFIRFDHCNGQELKGLYNRRVDEWKMFTSGSYNLDI